MTVTHPVALRDGRSHPGAYTYGTTSYPIDSDGAVDCPGDLEEEIAAALAEHYDVDVEQLLAPEGDSDGGTSDEPGDTVCTCDPGEACDRCGGDCPTVKTDGEVCGGDRPCQYHDDQED